MKKIPARTRRQAKPIRTSTRRPRRTRPHRTSSPKPWSPLFDALPDPIALIDTEYRIVHANKAMLDALGSTAEQTRGQKCFMCIHNTDEPVPACPLRRFLETGIPQSAEIFEPRLNSYYDVRITPYYSAKGKLLGVLHVAHDITARVKAEATLQQHQANMTAQLENMGGPVWSIDSDFRLISGNTEFYRGFKAETGITLAPGDKPFGSTNPSSQSDEWRRYYERAFRGEKFTVELPARNAPTPRWFEYHFNPIATSTGEIVGVNVYGNDITARHLAADERNKFALGIERSSDAIFLTDVNGVIEYVNPAFEKIYGYSKTEAVGKTPRILKSGLIPPQVYENFWKTLLAKQVVEGELVNKTKDGRLINVQASANPILNEHGDIIGFLAIQHDITERKQTERALQESEKRYRDLFDNANDLFYIHDLAGNFLAINRTAERVSGYSLAEALKMNIRDVLAPEYHESTRKLFAPNLLGMVPHRLEVEMIAKDGKRIALELNMRLVFENDKPVAVQGIARDITERKRAEAALRESENRFRTLFNTMLDGFALHEIICDETGKPSDYRFLDVNPAFERLTGLRREAIIGKTARQVLPNLEAYWIDNYGKVALTGEPCAFENYSAELGKYFHVIAYSPQPRQFAIVFADVTDRTRAEQALREHNRNQQLLLDAARALTSTLDVTQVLEQIAANAKIILNANDSSIYLLEADRHTLTPVIVIDPLYQRESLATPLDIDHSLTGTAVKAGRAMIFNHPTAEASHMHIPGTPVENEERVIATPLIVDGQVLGAMCLNRLGTPFTEQDLALTETFALYASAALKNAQTHRNLVHQVADRKRAEAELAQERNLLRTLIDHLPDRIFFKDTESRYLLDNKAHRELIGVASISELVGKTAFDFYPAHIAARMQAEDQAIVRSGEPLIDKEERVIQHDGDTSHWSLTSKIPLKNEQGQVVGLIGVSRDITERKRAEETLAQERNLLRTLIDNLPDCVYVKDRQGHYLINNRMHLRTMGLEHQNETLGKTAFDFFAYSSAVEFYADEQTLLRTGEPLIDKEETLVTQPDNQLRWHLTSKLPLRNTAGEIIGLVGISRDITERKHAEVELAAEKARFQQLFENSPVAIALIDQTDRLISVNAAFESIFQYRQAEVVGKYINDLLVPPEKLDEASRVSAQVLSGKTLQMETVRQRKDGTHVHVEVTGVPVVQNGKPIALYAMYADITQRKHAEEQLRASEERFRLLVQSQGEGVAIADENETFLFANPAAENIFGVPHGALVGRNLKEFTDPNTFQFVMEQTERRREGKHDTYEMEIIRADGTRCSLIVTATPQHTATGEYAGALAVFRDISDRKQMEAQLQYTSTHDALTGIYNRTFFEAEMRRIEKSREYPVSILMADVDDLKKTNDSLGHPAGDDLLKRATAVLVSAFRAEDVIARIGGDEFAVLLPHTDATAAAEALARVKKNLQTVNANAPHPVPLSFSLGIATGEKGTPLSQVMKEADRRMYENKANKPTSR